jgi:splicing factor 45
LSTKSKIFVIIIKQKRDSNRKPISGVIGLNKMKLINDEMPPPPAINISYCSKDSKGSLLGGEWDVTQEYDPIWPNDYEVIMKERKEKRDREKELERTKELEERERRRRERFERTAPPNRSLGLDYDDDDEEDEDDKHSERSDKDRDRDRDRDRSRTSAGAAIAPPPSLLENTGDKDSANAQNNNFGVSSIAAKIMARMGYKEGQGLGKEEQGMSTALLVEKTSKRGGKIIHEKDNTSPVPLMPPPPPPPIQSNVALNPSELATESITEIMKNPSKVVLLRNMVGPGEVDDDLEPETKEECGKYGEVIRCLIYELKGAVCEEEAVRIFIEFKRVESAIKGLLSIFSIFVLYLLSINLIYSCC